MLRAMPQTRPDTTRPRLAAAVLAAACGAAAAQEAPPLQTVVVSATRHAMALVDAPAALSVVTREQIVAGGADNVLEALRGETGVTVFGRTIAGRKALALRGLDPRHTLFLVDGRRISASDGVIGHSDFQLDWVAMEDVERIEVVRGPLASLYGAEALGGVVQVFTRAPAHERLEGSAGIEGLAAGGARGGDGHRAAVRISGPLAPWLAGTLTASRTRRQAVASALDARLSDLEGRDKQEAAWRLRATAGAAHTVDVEQRLGREQRWAEAIERSGRRRLYTSVSDIDRRHTAATWNAEWAAGWHSTLRAYETRLTMDNVRSNGVAALRPNALVDRAADAQLSGRAAAAHLLTAGAELRDERLRNAALPGGEASAWHRSAYLQDELDAAPGVALTAGLRRDEHERFGGRWSPRLYGVWRVAGPWVLKGGYSRGFKPPTLKQITPGYREDEGPFTYVSNPALRAESNDGVEAGVAWDAPALGVQAMVFDNRVRNLILPRATAVTAPRPVYVFENVERARLRGAEVSSTLRVATWTFGANYQYLDARDGHGVRLEKRPRHTLGLTADWRSGRWRAGVRFDGTAGQLVPAAVATQPLQRVPPLTYVHVNAAVDVGRGVTLLAGVRNLGDTNPAERSPLYTWGEPPRTWRLALRAQW